MGITSSGLEPFTNLKSSNGAHSDGFISEDARVWGTYLHGLFDSDDFRGALLGLLRTQRGLDRAATTDFEALKEASIATLAAGVEQALDMGKLMEIIGTPFAAEPSRQKV
jgi:adenosylcobyric acid synthase